MGSLLSKSSQCKQEDTNKWEKMLYVYPDADKANHSAFTKEDFMKKIQEKIKFDVDISIAYIYATQLGSCCRCHYVLVFGTEKQYYSIEKDQKGIVLQLGIDENDVLQNYRGKKRDGTPVKKRNMRNRVLKRIKNIESFMRHFHDSNELQNTYALCPEEKNCQGFAKKYYKWLKK